LGFFIFVTIILVLVGIGVLIGIGIKVDDPQSGGGFVIGGTIVVGLLLLLAVTCFRSFHQVENGHIGIVKSFGSLVGTTEEGVVTTAPWQSLDEVSVKNELIQYDMTGDNAAVSKDSQAVFLLVQVNYRLNSADAVKLYRETGGDFVNRILDPAVYQNTKAVTARYKATDFPKNRDEIRRQIEEEIQNEVGEHGLQILNVSLKNVDFTDKLSQAIEQTVEAEQQAKRAQAQVLIKEAEARQLVAEAQGKAKAQRLQQRSLTKKYLQLRAIETLNPNVSVIICPPRSLCIPNSQLPAVGAVQEGEGK
jgi:regulator of protease activity HflC (stomatin/prohibitin superfamily)